MLTGRVPGRHGRDGSIDGNTAVPACRPQGQAFGLVKELHEKRPKVSEIESGSHNVYGTARLQAGNLATNETANGSTIC